MKLANIGSRAIKWASASLIISFISIAVLPLSGCGGSSSTNTSLSDAAHPETPHSISGVAQKGPFLPGSEIRVDQLSLNAQSTLKSFSAQTSGANSNFSFTLPEDWQSSDTNKPLQLTVKGSFLDESHSANNSKDSSPTAQQQITLNTLITQPKNTSVNLLTHWISLRAKFLMFREGKTLSAALAQATNELYDYSGIANADKLDISEDKINGSDNLQLLLLSGALLDAAKHYQQSSQHVINQIAVDFAEDGKINHQGKVWFKHIQAHIQNNPEDKTRQYAKILTQHLGRKDSLSLDELPNIINFASRPKAVTPQSITIETGQSVELDGSGSLSANGGSLEYTWVRVDHNNDISVSLNNRFIAKPNLTAPDQSTDLLFALFVTDENGLNDTSLYKVLVRTKQQLNHTPVATPQLNLATNEDTGLNITLQGTDEDGDTLSFITVQTPIILTHGTVTRKYPNKPNSPELIYTPNANEYTFPDEYGDSFTFTVSDGSSTSDEATITIKINPINDAPVIHNSLISVDEDAKDHKISLDVTDAEYDQLTFVLTQDAHYGTVNFLPPKEFYYTPLANYSGVDSFNYQVSDGQLTIDGTAEINVRSIQDNPNAIAPFTPVVVSKNTPTPILLEGSDPDADEIVSYVIETPPAHGTLSGNTDAPDLTYTPNNNYVGTDNFTFYVIDSKGLRSSSATFKLDVIETNNQPVANDLAASTKSNTPKHITLTASDTDLDALTLSLYTQKMQGSLTLPVVANTGGITTINMIYTPMLNTITPDSFTYSVNDGTDDSNIATVNISILNQAPIADAGTSQNAIAGSLFTLSGAASSDPENQIITYLWNQESGTSVTLSDDRSVNPSFTVPSASGELIFSLMVTDSENISSSNPSIVTITVPNQPPVIDSISTNISSIKSGQFVNLSSSTTDPENDTLTYLWSDGSAGGTFSSLANPNPIYTAPIGIATPTNITLTLTATAAGASVTRAVNITVNPNPPVASITNAPIDPVLPGDLITLNGNGVDQTNAPTPTFAWSISPSISLNTGSLLTDPSISFIVPAVTTQTTYSVSLHVTDIHGVTSINPGVAVIVVNPRPKAHAGNTQSVTIGAPVNLYGSLSTAPDNHSLSYAWTQKTGTAVTLQGANTKTPHFTAPITAGTLEFELVVTDTTTNATSAPSIVALAVNLPAPASLFIMKVQGSGDFIIPTLGTGYDYVFSCDDTLGYTHKTDSNGSAICSYTDNLPHHIKIAGTFPRINFNSGTGIDQPNRAKLTDIVQWGNIQWDTMQDAFRGCGNMTSTAQDTPNLSGVTNMNGMFDNAQSFSADINSWDVSNVIDMSSLFLGAAVFNQSLSNWDVSNVTDMSNMFHLAGNFNQDISGWDVGSVTNMSHMFHLTYGNSKFNNAGQLLNWNVSNVTNMSYMFTNANDFDQNLSGWDVSKVTDMSYMFRQSAGGIFNNGGQPLIWDVSSVLNMEHMFAFARQFKQSLPWGDSVRNVTNMKGMFYYAETFNGDISGWNVSSVTNMQRMFDTARIFNGNIGSWDVSSVVVMTDLFGQAELFNQDISNWDVSSVTNMTSMFRLASAFNQPLNKWAAKTNQVTDMSYMFTHAITFNQDISNWNVSNVTNMDSMFNGATNFNQDLGSWAINKLTNMNNMFTGINLLTAHYDSLLTQWAAKLNPATGFSAQIFDAGSSQFSPSSATAHVFFEGKFSQVIDGGQVPSTNLAPIADAGSNQSNISPGAVVTLDGSGSSDPEQQQLTYQWAQTSGTSVSLDNDKSITPQFTAPSSATTLTFTLVVTDDQGLSSTTPSTITVIIPNQPPVINSFSNGNVNPLYSGQTINLTSSATDPEDGSNINYLWSITTNGVITNIATTANTPFTAPDVVTSTNYALKLKVTDSGGVSVTTNVTITVLPLPVADAGPAQDVTIGSTVVLDGSLSSAPAGHSLSYAWSQTGGASVGLQNSNSETASFIAPTSATTLIFDLVVTDLTTDASSAPVSVTINIALPNPANLFIMKVQGAGTFTIPTRIDSSKTQKYDFVFRCDDASSYTHITESLLSSDNASCNYTSEAVHNISIAGNFPRLDFKLGKGNNQPNRDKLIDITQWGNMQWDTMKSAFYSCSNLLTVPNDSTFDLTNVTSMELMFAYASSFNQNLNNWNVSNVNNMYGMFMSAESFNGNINTWDVANVSDMGAMFNNAIAFTQNLGLWSSKLNNVLHMNSMFHGATSFNGIIKDWNVSNVIDMWGMFKYAEAFNQDLNWNVSNVTKMQNMFDGAILFNGILGNSVSNWNVSNVTDMSAMFNNAHKFNQDISQWNVGTVDNMNWMFQGATDFNQSFNWNVGNVTKMQQMFKDAVSFNQPLNWDVRKVTTMQQMFDNAVSFNQPLNWEVRDVTTMKKMFYSAKQFEGKNLALDTSSGGVTDMYAMFAKADAFTGIGSNLPLWNVSKVTDMGSMFQSTVFNEDISAWDVSSVTNMSWMFYTVTLSTPNYDKLLNSWVTHLNPALRGTLFDGGDSQFSPVSMDTRNTFIALFTDNGATSENFTDGGPATNPIAIIDSSKLPVPILVNQPFSIEDGGSFDPVPDGSVYSWSVTLVSSPAGSTVISSDTGAAVSPGDQLIVGFTTPPPSFDYLAKEFTADQAGTYEFKLGLERLTTSLIWISGSTTISITVE